MRTIFKSTVLKQKKRFEGRGARGGGNPELLVTQMMIETPPLMLKAQNV